MSSHREWTRVYAVEFSLILAKEAPDLLIRQVLHVAGRPATGTPL